MVKWFSISMRLLYLESKFCNTKKKLDAISNKSRRVEYIVMKLLTSVNANKPSPVATARPKITDTASEPSWKVETITIQDLCLQNNRNCKI